MSSIGKKNKDFEEVKNLAQLKDFSKQFRLKEDNLSPDEKEIFNWMKA